MLDFLKSIFGIKPKKPEVTHAVDGHGDVHEVVKEVKEVKEVKKADTKKEEPSIKRLTKKELNGMTKGKIWQAAKDNLGVELNYKAKKEALVQAYMEAQRKK